MGEDNVITAYVRAELAQVLLDLEKRPDEAEELAAQAWTRSSEEEVVACSPR